MTSPSTATRIHAIDVATIDVATDRPVLDTDGPVRIVMSRPDGRAAEAMVRKLGLDPAELTRTAAQHRRRIHAAADVATADAIDRSAASAARLASIMQAHAGDLQQLDSPQGPYTSVAVPSRIFTTGDIQLHTQHLESFNSTAKVSRAEHEDFSSQTVEFVFPYVNTSGTDQVMTVSGVIGLNGVIGAGDEGGWTVFGHGHNRLQVTGQLVVFGDTDDANTGFLAESYRFADIDAFEDSWPQSVGAVESQNITRGTALQATDLLVKAGHQRIFHLVMRFDCASSNGDTHYDFNSGAFAVQGFGLFIHITS